VARLMQLMHFFVDSTASIIHPSISTLKIKNSIVRQNARSYNNYLLKSLYEYT
jgi:hypothetical protein